MITQQIIEKWNHHPLVIDHEADLEQILTDPKYRLVGPQDFLDVILTIHQEWLTTPEALVAILRDPILALPVNNRPSRLRQMIDEIKQQQKPQNT